MWPKGQKARQNDAFTQLTHTSSSSSSSWEALPRTTWVCTQKNAPHDAANLNFEKMRFFFLPWLQRCPRLLHQPRLNVLWRKLKRQQSSLKCRFLTCQRDCPIGNPLLMNSHQVDNNFQGPKKWIFKEFVVLKNLYFSTFLSAGPELMCLLRYQASHGRPIVEFVSTPQHFN